MLWVTVKKQSWLRVTISRPFLAASFPLYLLYIIYILGCLPTIYIVIYAIFNLQGGKEGAVTLFVSLASSQLPDVGERSEKLKSVSNLVQQDLTELDQSQTIHDHVVHWNEIRFV